MAERYGGELAEALPEVDQVAGFGVPVNLPASHGPEAHPGVRRCPSRRSICSTCPGRSRRQPVGVREDRRGLRPLAAGSAPSRRSVARSAAATSSSILAEVEQLEAQEIVLVAQDLASYGKDRPDELGAGSIVPLVRAVSAMVPWTRLLYLYPSDLTDELIDAICDTGVPYFDLSLQHVSKPLLRRMRRWGDGERFLRRIADIRDREPQAAFRSNFIVGYPGETEDDHDQLLAFVEEAQLDWCGFFAYSPEEGTYAMELDGAVDPRLMHERLAELREMQDDITARRRDDLIGEHASRCSSIEPGEARSTREAPEIDGIIEVPASPGGRSVPRGSCGRCHGSRSRGRLGLMPVDPSAIKTWANLVTVARVLIAPFMLVLIPDDAGWLVGGVRAVVRAVRQRRHRRLPGPPPRRHQPRGVPRPAGRQGARARRDVHPRRQRHVLDRAGASSSSARELAHQPVPHVRGREGRQRAGQQDRQVEDVRAAAGGRLRHHAAHRARREVAVERPAVDLGGARADQRRPVRLPSDASARDCRCRRGATVADHAL